MNCLQALLVCVLSLTSTALAQTDQKITLFSETPTSPGQSAYLSVLNQELVGAGFAVTGDGDVLPLERGEIRAALRETGSALGLVFLQSQIGEGDAAAALLSAPGAFVDLDEQRAALQGVIGDAASPSYS
jgi:hypothetical protein